jgi:ABC-type nitrate/sulfonate/bicarbonate transport system ATPase subunit
VVLSERPAKVVDVVNINLPRPRKVMMKASRKYIALCERIRKKIRA